MAAATSGFSTAGIPRLRWPRSDRDDAHVQETKSRSCKSPGELAVFGAGRRVRGGPSSRMIQVEQSCAALVQVGPDISECFPTSLWCKQVGRFCAMASSGWTSSRPRSSASARSFACLSTDPRSSPAEPCGSLPVKPAARPRPPCPCRCGTARSGRRRPSRCTAPHSPSSGPNCAWSPAGRCAGCTSRSSLLTGSSISRGELTVATRHPVASEAPIQPVFARAIG